MVPSAEKRAIRGGCICLGVVLAINLRIDIAAQTFRTPVLCLCAPVESISAVAASIAIIVSFENPGIHWYILDLHCEVEDEETEFFGQFGRQGKHDSGLDLAIRFFL